MRRQNTFPNEISDDERLALLQGAAFAGSQTRLTLASKRLLDARITEISILLKQQYRCAVCAGKMDPFIVQDLQRLLHIQ